MQEPPPPQPPLLDANDALSLPEALGPQHVEPIYRTLLAVLTVDSANPQPRRDAEALLRAFEAVPYYTDVLCTIVASPDAHDDARLLALLCIQNVVRRHWREGPGGLMTRGGSSGLMGMRRHLREAAAAGEAEEAGDPQRALFLRQLRREYVVGEEEKARLRAFLLDRMDEPNDLMAKNLAHVLAKVVRADWPRRWPDFFPQLLGRLQLEEEGGGSNGGPRPLSLQTVRAIHSLHRATKELAGKALLADKMAFQGMARLLFPVAYQRLWRPRMGQLLQGLNSIQQQQQQEAALPADLAALAMVVKTCTKILYFLAVQHADALDPAELDAFLRDLHGCFPPLLAAQRTLLLFRSQSQQQQQHPMVPLIGRLTKHGARLVVELQKRSPLALRGRLLPAYLELFYGELEGASSGPHAEALLWADGDASDPCRHFFLQGCAFLGNVVTCSDYVWEEDEEEEQPLNGNGAAHAHGHHHISFEADGERPRQWVKEAHDVVQAFYSQDRLLKLCDLVLERLLGLRPADLEAWRDEPEEFMLEEEQRKPDDDIRAAAESLFLSLFDARRELIGPKLAAILSNQEGQMNAAAAAAAASKTCTLIPPPEVLFWDRVYLVLGLTTYSLRDFVDLVAWFHACFLPAMTALLAPPEQPQPEPATNPLPPILLRRLVYLVACSASDVPKDLRPTVYQLLAAALDPSNPRTDLVVALHAIDALQALVNDWEFMANRHELTPMLGPILGSLYRVIAAAQELGNKSKALALVILLITVMGEVKARTTSTSGGQQQGEQDDVIMQLAPHIVAPLPGIWAAAADGTSGAGDGSEDGGGEDTSAMLDLRNGVMGVLIALLPRVGPRVAQGYHPALLPMLDAATDVRRAESLSLLEDGLRLWHVTLTQAEAYDAQGIGALFPRVVGVLEHGFEHVKAAMLLIEDYLVVGGAAFLQQHLPALLHCLRLTLGVESGGRGGVVERGLGCVVRVMETLLVGFPEEGTRALIDAGVHDRLLQQSLAPPSSSSSPSSPNGTGACGEATRVQFLSALARSLLTAPAIFLPYLQRLSVEPLVLVDAMLALFDEVPSGSTTAGSSGGNAASPSSAPARRKLWAMALLFLLSGGGESGLPDAGGRRQALVLGMLGRLEQVINVCLDVLAEIEAEARERQEAAEAGGAGGAGGCHVRGTGSGNLHGLEAEELLEDLAYAEEASGGGIYHPHGHASSTYAPHPLVQALVAANDAVARVELKECLQGALGAARAVAGDAAFEAAVRAVHPAVVEQMQQATT